MPVPERGDQRHDLLRRKQLVEARLLHVQHLAAQRQDGLELPVAALLGRAARGVALDDVDLAQRRILLLAIGQLARQAHAVEHALAARHLARLARGVARARGVDDLAADDLGVVRRFLQVVVERLRDDVFHRRAHFARHQLVLGLRLNFGSGTLTREHAGQAFAHVVAGRLDLGLLGELVVVDVLVDDARHRGAQAGQVGAAVALRDVVGEAQHLLVVAVVPLHRHFDRCTLSFSPVAWNTFGCRTFLPLLMNSTKPFTPPTKAKVVFLAVALVDQADLHAVVQERQFAQALARGCRSGSRRCRRSHVGQEVHLGAALLGLADDLHRRI